MTAARLLEFLRFVKLRRTIFTNVFQINLTKTRNNFLYQLSWTRQISQHICSRTEHTGLCCTIQWSTDSSHKGNWGQVDKCSRFGLQNFGDNYMWYRFLLESSKQQLTKHQRWKLLIECQGHHIQNIRLISWNRQFVILLKLTEWYILIYWSSMKARCRNKILLFSGNIRWPDNVVSNYLTLGWFLLMCYFFSGR